MKARVSFEAQTKKILWINMTLKMPRKDESKVSIPAM